VRDLARRIEKSLARDGFRATAERGTRFCLRGARALLPGRRAAIAERAARERAFDARHGVQTAQIHMARRNDITGARWQSGNKYEALDVGFDFAGALGCCVDLQPADFVFVDVGAGMGRALLLAARLRFKRLIGIEYSSELVAIARRNTQAARGLDIDPEKLEVAHADAITYQLPNEPLVIFLYNPFDCEAMGEFVEHVKASIASLPRRVVVVYLNAQCDAEWRQSGLVRCVGEWQDAMIYDSGVRP
jgi:SAM-dependent methyltransferase